MKVNDVVPTNMLPIVVILDKSHFKTSESNAHAPLNTAREDATKKRKDQPTTAQTTRGKSHFVNSKYTQRKVRHREGESVHLLYAIFVTAPVFHLDTFELNADAKLNTAGEGATKKRKTNPPQTTKRYRFKNTTQK